MPAELTPVSPGVVRVSWSEELQAQGLGPSVEAVREALVTGFLSLIHI